MCSDLNKEMESNIAIKLEGVSKCFHVYDQPYHRFLQGLYRGRKQFFKEFWALRGISLEVKKGETVGIIGPNGSGKSTLLQVICGTLASTSGEFSVNGRIAALLELGAGFNPEFTGKENVYMNATILGLNNKEIDTKYDEIVEFADIGNFIEQPVKTYSSGMYVRLAFAIAISVNPDILIVDEALSVGDLNFRNKCMHKIKQLKDAGVTIFFVSHDLGTVQTICDRAIWLLDGTVKHDGKAVAVCQEFYAFMTGSVEKEQASQVVIQQASDLAEFTKITIESCREKNGLPSFEVSENITFNFELNRKTELGKIVFAVSIYRDDKDWLIGQTSRESEVYWEVGIGKLCGRVVLSPNILAPGNYYSAFAAYSEDLTICYALTDLATPFCIRSDYPVWGKVVAPCRWVSLHE